jgi:hypothetical protein
VDAQLQVFCTLDKTGDLASYGRRIKQFGSHHRIFDLDGIWHWQKHWIFWIDLGVNGIGFFFVGMTSGFSLPTVLANPKAKETAKFKD